MNQIDIGTILVVIWCILIAIMLWHLFSNDATTLSDEFIAAIYEALADGDKHGYELVKWFKTNHPELLKSDKPGLYPMLHRMEEEGRIISRTETDQMTNRLRRYYSLSKGK